MAALVSPPGRRMAHGNLAHSRDQHRCLAGQIRRSRPKNAIQCAACRSTQGGSSGRAVPGQDLLLLLEELVSAVHARLAAVRGPGRPHLSAVAGSPRDSPQSSWPHRRASRRGCCVHARARRAGGGRKSAGSALARRQPAVSWHAVVTGCRGAAKHRTPSQPRLSQAATASLNTARSSSCG